MKYKEAYIEAHKLVKNSKQIVERCNASIFNRSTVDGKYKQTKRMIVMGTLLDLIHALSDHDLNACSPNCEVCEFLKDE